MYSVYMISVIDATRPCDDDAFMGAKCRSFCYMYCLGGRLKISYRSSKVSESCKLIESITTTNTDHHDQCII